MLLYKEIIWFVTKKIAESVFSSGIDNYRKDYQEYHDMAWC
jgi:hypothetical protein